MFTILDPPTMLIQSSNMTFVKGNNIELFCNAISYPMFNATWYKSNELINSATKVYNDASGNNQTTTLTITSANVTDEGFYMCTLTNILGSITSKAIWIDYQSKFDGLPYATYITVNLDKI